MRLSEQEGRKIKEGINRTIAKTISAMTLVTLMVHKLSAEKDISKRLEPALNNVGDWASDEMGNYGADPAEFFRLLALKTRDEIQETLELLRERS